MSSQHDQSYRRGIEDAAKVQCVYCRTADTFEPARLIEGSKGLWHFGNGNNFQCKASAIRALIPVSTAPQAVCENCNHVEPHDGPAGDINDACMHTCCNCAYDSRPALPATVPARPKRVWLTDGDPHWWPTAEQGDTEYMRVGDKNCYCVAFAQHGVEHPRGHQESGCAFAPTAQEEDEVPAEPIFRNGTNGHVHKFYRVNIDPALGHSYLWCLGCKLTQFLPEHDKNTCPDCALSTATVAQPFQDRIKPWLLACFGEQIAADKVERNHRFLEEALELVQACGCTQSEAHQLVDYTFNRPAGNPSQEVGGVMVTLAALCLANGFDMHEAGETELARIWTKVDVIRAKQAAKPKRSPLPEYVAPSISDQAQRVADKLRPFYDPWHIDMDKVAREVAEIIQAAYKGEDQLYDECQKRMDQVVDAVVEWHKCDDDTWQEKADHLEASIDSLLKLRGCDICHKAVPVRYCDLCKLNYCNEGEDDDRFCAIEHGNRHEDSVANQGEQPAPTEVS